MSLCYTFVMKDMLFSVRFVLSRRDGALITVFASIIFLFLLVLFQNSKAAFFLLHLATDSFSHTAWIFVKTLFDISNTFTVSTFILAVLGSLLSGINLAITYVYLKTRGELILKSGLYTGFGLVLALLGIGCAACGTAFLSLLLGFLGFSTMLSILPYQGQEIGYIGLIFLVMATYFLSKKMSAPNVC